MAIFVEVEDDPWKLGVVAGAVVFVGQTLLTLGYDSNGSRRGLGIYTPALKRDIVELGVQGVRRRHWQKSLCLQSGRSDDLELGQAGPSGVPTSVWPINRAARDSGSRAQ